MHWVRKEEISNLNLADGFSELLQVMLDDDLNTLPGGHVEEGESIVDAVIREMREETGLTIRSPKLCGNLSNHPLLYPVINNDFPYVSNIMSSILHVLCDP